MSRIINKYKWPAGLLSISLFAFFLIPYSFTKKNPLHENNLPFYLVKKKPFEIKIIESGVLRSFRSVTLASELPSNRAKIIKLIPEGAYVEKGEVLVEFDPTPFKDDIKKYQTEIKEAEGVLAQTKEDLKLQFAKGDEELNTAKHNIKLSEMELKNILEGEGPLKVKEAKKNLLETDNDWNLANSEYKDLKSMLSDGFVTQMEVEKARIKADRAKNNYELAKEKYQTLEELIYPAEIEKARLELKKKKDFLGKLKQSNYYKILRNQAIVARAENKLKSAREKMRTAKEQLSKTVIHAPSPGFVIFKELPILGERRKVQVGESVWANQGFIILPDISKMVVEIKIREVDINKVKKGQNVLIQVDSYPDLMLHGKVELIGTLAKKDQKNKSGAKYFNVRIMVNEFDNRLRPGMTARATIIVDTFKETIIVPIESVFEKEGKTICFVLKEGKAVMREVSLGKSNEDYIIVEKGLDKGEKVLLRKPDEVVF